MAGAPGALLMANGTDDASSHAHRADDVARAAAAVRAYVAHSAAPLPAPEIGIILGTGLGALGTAIAVDAAVPFEQIPGFPLSTVESHAGRLLLGTLGGRRVAALQGPPIRSL